MRPIKFRVWDKFNKQMISDTHEYRHYGIDFGMDGCWRCGKSNAGGDYWHTIGPEEGAVLMQYTGLQDKNGKEIYEGDIMLKRCPCCTEFDEYGVVVFDCGSFKFQSDLSTKCNHDFAFRYQEYEVIGNIYENKDLLVEVK